MPGVIAVLSGEDAERDGLKPIPFRPLTVNRHEVALQASFLAPYPLLPVDKVRFVGQAVAVVIADTLAGAKDAAERVIVEYGRFPRCGDLSAAGGARVGITNNAWIPSIGDAAL